MRKHVGNPVQLYPGLAQREVVNLFGIPIMTEGNPDEGNPSGDYAEHRKGLETYPISNTERRVNSSGNMKID